MTVTEILRFLGMANQMSKFSPLLTGKTKLLCDLWVQKYSGFGETLMKSIP